MPLDLFERFAFDGTRTPKVLVALATCDHVTEAVVVSTCNRTEVYLVAERFHAAYQEVRDVLAELAHVAPEDFADHLYVHYDDEAVRHLFRVVAGLDSDVLGDTEVLSQVRGAWTTAVDEGTVGPSLNLLFRHAVETGKRARTETGIASGTASVSHAAVEMAAERLGTVAGRTVLVIGAGTIGRSMATALKGAGAERVLVANRTAERAAALAADIDGEVVPLSQLDSALAECDVLLTSTGATSVIIDHAELESALARRDSDPLLVVDVAVPRDVDPSVGELPGVTLLDIDDLRTFAQAGIEGRRREMSAVEGIVLDEADRYRADVSARAAAPLVAALHARAEDLRQAEVARFAGRLGGLDDRQKAAVEGLTRALLAKVLHEPTVRLKATAGTPAGERMAESLRDLYGLSE
ncbi:glutamyl-tRNA reductase [Iamia sp. SCSIO 61187]|uniref:glutamyl-tRNA reductase n=1 Tax=Iamia sp. SCSIO 61187 TaxID=2722752 RepID=UPI001C62F20A|nr:glutamyl-tRNA reductase [Iamia sp. SCSIO 61187]QYG94839.1 glutamyl-tRNA reductase [Iamia sp. SCSIO 61187]